MKKLNKSATATFNRIISTGDDYQKIDNTNGAFMPLVVEKLGTHDIGTVYSFAHYFEQNGDLCQDPDMTFLSRSDGSVVPMTFQQAMPPIYTEAVFFDNGWKVATRSQRDITSFANTWLKNIKNQQGV